MKIAASVLLLLPAACAANVDGAPRMIVGAVPVGDFSLPIESVVERRYAQVVRQQFDFSCGSAALATLLRYHYDYDVEEHNAFRGMWSRGDQDQIRKLGFSLLDMKRWLASRGISADGYGVTLDRIADTGIPGIALISVKNYRHFVVVKGIQGDEVLLGDPSVGITAMPRDQFAKAWNGIYFVIADDQATAKRRFNQRGQWALHTRSPISTAFSEPVSQQALALTLPLAGGLR